MRKINFVQDCFYHVYNRGVDKRSIFMNERDYQRFLRGLYEFNNEGINSNVGHRFTMSVENTTSDEFKLGLINHDPIVDIVAFCLMPNHFHLLLRSKYDAAVSEFMHRIGTSYTNYFNLKYARVGALFQGPFKAKLVNSDAYLTSLVRYIHLNPLDLIVPDFKEKAIADWDKINEFLLNYKWSSHRHYLGEKGLEEVIDSSFVLSNYFTNINVYQKFMGQWNFGSDQNIKHLILD